MRKFFLLLALLCPWLSACSLSPAINHQALDYFRANDLAANQIILMNILRAKDGAPLHFSELSQIRGQLSVQAAASSTFPFGPIAHATQLPRRLATLGLTVSSAAVRRCCSTRRRVRAACAMRRNLGWKT
jgi:hypothetical protein